MSLLASSNVTWGISGSDFLVGYGLLALAAFLGILLVRRRLAADPAVTAAGELSTRPHDVAYLNGGAELAVLSALSSMRVAGTIITEGRGWVRPGPAPGQGADELERAIHEAATGSILRRELLTRAIVRTALENARERLESVGLLLSARQRRRIKLAGFGMVAVAALGLARLLAGMANGAPVGYLVLELVVVGFLAAKLLTKVPRRSRRGTAELRGLRTRHRALAPRMRPDWTAYGPALAGLGVGVFGAGAVWASAPAFAADLEAKRQSGLAASGYHGGYNGGGGGCAGSGGGCGGGGCGGGGCGGGCGG